ncbi:M43 family zinc metalloprotease, partial [Flavobacteriales bacterium]|nr:M43 family zinc metalloprotease [Flavobacteriales bacterium]
MLKNIHLLLIFLFIGFISVSQGSVINKINNQLPELLNIPFSGEPCASGYLEEELLKDSAYVQMRNFIEQQLQIQIAQQNVSRGAGTVYTIPVVFHIMHSGEAVGDSTNISLAQVQSTITALNRDFRRTSADGGIANSGPLGIDAEIEFCLAQRDPSGLATTGVTRHDMSGDQAYIDSGVYHTPGSWRGDASIKTLVNWDNTQYLNVWVVNKIKKTTNLYSGGYTGGVQGYAYFPGATSPDDGIVILSTATGNDPTGVNGYNLWYATDDGRTLTHEVGHYLNLYHTFNNTLVCDTSGVNCATIGDRCCDTPPTIQGAGNNCTTPVCPLENKENYMQYQNRACASDFTPDQVARMRAVLT